MAPPVRSQPFGATFDLSGNLDSKFQEVWERLTERERRFLEANPATGLQDIHQQIYEIQDTNSVLRNFARLQPYVEGLNRYHNVVSVFVQVNPGILSLIWGPIKFLLHLGKNCLDLFDQILDVFDEIGKSIPQFDAMKGLFPDDDQFAMYLSYFYTEILEFHLASLKVWRRSGLKILFEAAWPRYNDTFKRTLKNISAHKDVLNRHFQFRGMQEILKYQQESLKYQLGNLNYQKEEREVRMMDLLSKHLERQDHNTSDLLHGVEQTLGKYPSTGQWIFNHPDFLNWKDLTKMDASQRFLWLVGIPGAGKTYVSVSILDNFGGSLISQICSWDKTLAMIAIEKYELNSSYKRGLQSHKELEEPILKELISGMGGEPCYALLDGLDECSETERVGLAKALIRLTNDCPAFRPLIASRKEVDLIELLHEAATEIIVDEHNRSDIKLYTAQRLYDLGNRIYDTKSFDFKTQEFLDKAIEKIISESSGLFLFVRLVIDNLECQSTAEEFSEELGNIPCHDHLNEIYGRIWHGIKDRNPKQHAHIVRIFSWIICAKRPLKITEIEKAIMIMPGDRQLHTERKLTRAKILRLCGCIVRADEYITLVHFSAKEYLIQKQLTGLNLLSLADAFTIVATTCLAYLNFNVFDDHTHMETNRFDDELIESGAYVLNDYISEYWFYHLQKSCERNPSALTEQLGHLLEARWNSSFPTSKEVCIRIPPKIEMFKSILSDIQLRKLKHVSEYEWKMLYAWDDLPISPLTLPETTRRLKSRFDETAVRKCIPNCTKSFSCSGLHEIYGKSLFYCSIPRCCEAYPTESSRKNHLAYHRPFRCEIVSCHYHSLRFQTLAQLRDHQNSAHKLSPPPCHSSLNCDWTGLNTAIKTGLLLNLARQAEFETFKYVFQSQSEEEQVSITEDLLDEVVDLGGEPKIFNLILSKSPEKLLKGVLLIKAMRNGWFDNVQLFLDRGVNVTHSEDRETLLHIAAGQENGLEIVRLLLDRGATAEAKNSHGDTALHFAAGQENGLEIVRLLLDRGATAEAKNSHGDTALHFAAGQKNGLEIVRLLLDRGATIEAKNSRQNTALHLAAGQKNGLEIVRLLLDRGATTEAKNPNELTALHLAAGQENGLEIVRLLLDRGATTEVKNSNNLTALHLAAGQKNGLEIVRLLLDRGATTEVNNSIKLTALHLAIGQENGFEIVRLLLDRGATTEAKNSYGRTALHLAARQKNGLEIVRLLLDRGATIEAKDSNKLTALHFAVGQENGLEIVQLLLDRGATTEAKNFYGDNVLHHATIKNHGLILEMARLLIDWGANVDSVGNNGITVLHSALETNAPINYIKFLLNKGAQINIEDNYSWTALHFAVRFNGNIDVIDALLDDGAAINAKTKSGKTPLHILCHSQMIKSFVFRELNMRLTCQSIERLLIRGADVNLKDNKGRTPLHCFGCVADDEDRLKKKSLPKFDRIREALRMLLSHGANPEATDEDGKTPLTMTPRLSEIIQSLDMEAVRNSSG